MSGRRARLIRKLLAAEYPDGYTRRQYHAAKRAYLRSRSR